MLRLEAKTEAVLSILLRSTLGFLHRQETWRLRKV